MLSSGIGIQMWLFFGIGSKHSLLGGWEKYSSHGTFVKSVLSRGGVRLRTLGSDRKYQTAKLSRVYAEGGKVTAMSHLRCL